MFQFSAGQVEGKRSINLSSASQSAMVQILHFGSHAKAAFLSEAHCLDDNESRQSCFFTFAERKNVRRFARVLSVAPFCQLH